MITALGISAKKISTSLLKIGIPADIWARLSKEPLLVLLDDHTPSPEPPDFEKFGISPSKILPFSNLKIDVLGERRKVFVRKCPEHGFWEESETFEGLCPLCGKKTSLVEWKGLFVRGKRADHVRYGLRKWIIEDWALREFPKLVWRGNTPKLSVKEFEPPHLVRFLVAISLDKDSLRIHRRSLEMAQNLLIEDVYGFLRRLDFLERVKPVEVDARFNWQNVGQKIVDLAKLGNLLLSSLESWKTKKALGILWGIAKEVVFGLEAVLPEQGHALHRWLAGGRFPILKKISFSLELEEPPTDFSFFRIGKVLHVHKSRAGPLLIIEGGFRALGKGKRGEYVVFIPMREIKVSGVRINAKLLLAGDAKIVSQISGVIRPV